MTTLLYWTEECVSIQNIYFRGRLESHNLYVTLVTLFQKMYDFSLTAGSSYDVTTSVRQLMFGYRMRLAQDLQFVESLKTYHDHCKMYIIVLNPWNSVFSFHVLPWFCFMIWCMSMKLICSSYHIRWCVKFETVWSCAHNFFADLRFTSLVSHYADVYE